MTSYFARVLNIQILTTNFRAPDVYEISMQINNKSLWSPDSKCQHPIFFSFFYFHFFISREIYYTTAAAVTIPVDSLEGAQAKHRISNYSHKITAAGKIKLAANFLPLHN